MFGTTRIRKWKTEGKKFGSIQKDSDNKLGASVSVDQLKPYQPGLVPKFSGKLTSARIWAFQVMVGHFSDFTYV